MADAVQFLPAGPIRGDQAVTAPGQKALIISECHFRFRIDGADMPANQIRSLDLATGRAILLPPRRHAVACEACGAPWVARARALGGYECKVCGSTLGPGGRVGEYEHTGRIQILTTDESPSWLPPAGTVIAEGP
jgi:hypothetical protein